MCNRKTIRGTPFYDVSLTQYRACVEYKHVISNRRSSFQFHALACWILCVGCCTIALEWTGYFSFFLRNLISVKIFLLPLEKNLNILTSTEIFQFPHSARYLAEYIFRSSVHIQECTHHFIGYHGRFKNSRVGCWSRCVRWYSHCAGRLFSSFFSENFKFNST